MMYVAHFDIEMLRAPQKRSETVSSLRFSLRQVPRTTTACTFSTSQLPKVLRT